MTKIIIIPGHTSTAALVALLEARQKAPIVAIEDNWKECWECGTEHMRTEQCPTCHPIQCFECDAWMKKFDACPVCNPECRHE